jgi:hypothetical protein
MAHGRHKVPRSGKVTLAAPIRAWATLLAPAAPALLVGEPSSWAPALALGDLRQRAQSGMWKSVHCQSNFRRLD